MMTQTKLLKIYFGNGYTEIYLDNWSQYKGKINKESDDIIENIRKEAINNKDNLVVIREYINFKD